MFFIGRRVLALLTTLALFFTMLMPLTSLSASSQQEGLFAEVNAYRQKNGKSTLKRDADLERRAQAHAEDMAKRNYFSHTSPDGTTFAVRMNGYGGKAGENIAAGQLNAAAVVQAWSKSPGHNTNMLSSDFKAMGLGYAYNAQSTYKHYWVLILGSKDVADQPPTPPAEDPKPADPKPEEPKPTDPVPTNPVPVAPKPIEKPRDGSKDVRPPKPPKSTPEEIRSRFQERLRERMAVIMDKLQISSLTKEIKACK